MAYVLGFVAADGHITDKGVLIINLAIRDLEHLEMINNLLDNINPVAKYEAKIKDKSYPAAKLKCNNVSVIKEYLNLSLECYKTLELNFPYIPKEYRSHFIRGYMDGDGPIMIKYRPKDRQYAILQVDFIGTENFLNSLIKIFCDEVSTRFKKLSPKGRNFTIRYTSTEAHKILDYLYKDSDNLRLERKYKRFQGYLDICKLLGRDINANIKRDPSTGRFIKKNLYRMKR